MHFCLNRISRIDKVVDTKYHIEIHIEKDSIYEPRDYQFRSGTHVSLNTLEIRNKNTVEPKTLG